MAWCCLLLLILGAHAQRGLRWLSCLSVIHSVCYARTHFSSHRSRQKQAHIPSDGRRSENTWDFLWNCFVAELERFSVRTVRAMAAILTTRMCVRTYAYHPNARDYFKFRESVDSLCRDGADMPRPPYIGKACTRPNLEDLSLFRYLIMVCEWFCTQ